MLLAPRPERSSGLALWVGWLLLLFLLAWHAVMVATRPYGLDEFEHFHAAWYVAGGALPYRDFFEHHHGLLWYALAPVARLWHDSFSGLFVARLLVGCFFAGAAALLVALGQRYRDRLAGVWAAVLWTSLAPVQMSACEVRPDTPMTFLLLLGFYLSLRGSARSAFGAGVSWGLAFLTLQKAVLFVPALALAPCVVLLSGERDGRRRARLILTGAALPVLAAGLALAWHGALDDWWRWCIEFNRTAPALAGAWYTHGLEPLRKAILHTNTFAVVAMGAGLLTGLRRRVDACWSWTAVLFLATLVVTRRPFDQYAVPATTLAAVLGGAWLSACFRRASRPAALALLLALAVVGLFAQERPHAWVELRALRARALQAARHDYVLAHTSPEDVVLQGYPAFNLFRRDAGFLWLLPYDLPARAASVGLPSGPTFRELVRTTRPAFLSLGGALYRGGDMDPADRAWLEEVAGYRWLPQWKLHARPEAGPAPATRTVHASAPSITR